MVAGSIARLGADYLVDLKAADCQSGNPLDEEQKKAADRDGVLKALNAASRDMRAMLGESLATIQKYDPPAEQATTSSIEALRSYSLGVKMRATGGSQMSIPFFKRAVELDPNFAMAYARLGTAYYSVDQIDDADKATRQAFALRDHVSEREKLYIESHYYVTTTGQLDKAIESLKEWAQAYPRDPLAHADLGIVYAILGRHEDNLKEQLEAIRLASSNSTYYVPLATAYANLDRFKEAKFTMQQADARKLDDPFFVDVKYQLAFVFGEFDDANRRAAAESLARSSNTLLPYESDVATYYGHLVEARDLMKIAEQNAQRDNEGESVRAYQAIQALHEAELANPGEAKKLAETALVNEPAKQVQILAALALARAGDVNHATAIAHDLQRRYPVDTVLNAYWMPCILASIEIKQNSPAKALALLQAAASYELGIPQAPTNLAPYPIFLRGEAYLTLKDGAAAAAEFQIIMNHRGVTSTSPLGSLAVLGLARAYALQSGRLGVSSSTALRMVSHSGSTNLEMTEKARSEYREFLALWAHADKNLPTLKEAQAEYRLMQQ